MNVNYKECCGCTACQQICPMQCISMVSDEEGFLYPKIDESICVRCNKCESICPILHPDMPKRKTEAYIGYAINESIRRSSSSGGVFSLAAEYVLRQNGVVFGAAYDEDFSVHHICIESEEELYKLRGSKYVQSRLENTYVEAKKCLKNDQLVLFSGTGCQIAGLKKYLGTKYDNLLTIDILCHGVPSPKVWHLYLEDKEEKYGSRISYIQQRDKKLGWRKYAIKIQFKNGQEYCVPFSNDKFMNMFLSNINLRPSCHNCQFKSFPRVSDITIGDSWGIQNYMPEMDDDKGTSVILVHTEKGRRVLNEIQKKLIIKMAELDKALPLTADSRISVMKHPNRERFWADLQAGKSFNEIYKNTKKNIVQKVFCYIQMKIRIWKG